jgi:hypothetical protein
MGTAVRTEAVPAIRPYEGGSRWPEAARVAAALSLFAGAIHLAALPEHLGESVWFGAFFLCSGAFQIASGIRMRTRPTPGLATTVALANAAVVGLWVLSRTEGVPVGPAPWVPEGIGLLDAVATVCEIGLVAVAVFMSRKRDAGTAKGSWRWPGVSLPR